MKSTKHLLLAPAVLVATTGSAHAYADPGTGSILLQGLLAAVLVVGALWPTIKQWLRSLLVRKAREEEA